MLRRFSDLRLALRLLVRERRAGELRLLAISIVIGVASLTAVSFLADRIRLALSQQAVQLLGGDLVLKSDQPWSPELRRVLAAQPLDHAETVTFPSMVLGGEGGQLSEIKAVSNAYPLRGTLRTAATLGAHDAATAGVPPPGEAWVDERLAAQAAFAPGQSVRVGQRVLRVTRVLTQEPDRSINFLGIAPRLLMNLDDLATTGLIQTGSRVRYRYLLAGPAEAVARFAATAERFLVRGQSLEDIESARPEIRGALARAERFLGLAAMLAIVLSAIAVGLAARRHVQRRLDACAVMRCLGLTQGRMLWIFSAQIAALGALATVVGVAIGFAAHAGLVSLLATLIDAELPAPSARPALQGLLLAALLLAGFALPPLVQLRHVPPLRVLRRELGAPRKGTLAGYAVAVAALAVVVVWVARDFKLALWVLAGMSIGLLLFSLVAWAAVMALGRLPAGVSFGAWHGLRSLAQRPGAAIVQTVALAVGGMALLLLTLTRSELLDTWSRAAPADAPNRFIIGVQAEQRAAVHAAIEAIAPGTTLWPMVRARLQAVNGVAIDPDEYADERARRLVEREFNLSAAVGLPPGNTVVDGRWFAPDELNATAPVGAASVEAGLAATLGLRVGDALKFTVAGQPLALRIVGLRQLDWSSMRVNFFVLLPPPMLVGQPASDVASFRLPDGAEPQLQALVARFPNLTVIDVTAILRQMQRVLAQVSAAVEFLFLFTVAAGVAVLYGAILTAFDERRYELAVMRALGARRVQLRSALLGELAGVGALAGGLAAAAASGLGIVIAHQFFELDLDFNVWSLPLAMLAGAVFAAAAGGHAIRSLTGAPALDALRGSV